MLQNESQADPMVRECIVRAAATWPSCLYATAACRWMAPGTV